VTRCTCLRGAPCVGLCVRLRDYSCLSYRTLTLQKKAKEGEEKEDGADAEEPDEEPMQEPLKYARGRNSGYHICVQVHT